MAQVRKSKTRSRPKSGKPVKITRRFLDVLTGAKEDAYYRVLDALGISRRENISPSKAAKRSGTTLKTMRKYASSVLEERSGRFYVKPSDRLPRRMRMLTSKGEVIVHTTSSRTATLIAEYNNALREYVLTRDTTELKRFASKTVRSGGEQYTFATETRTLDRYVRAGAVHFVDIYGRGPKA
jgi:uncharacterized protein YaaR (DUF327 family)